MEANWVQNGVVKLWTEAFGNPKNPAILLIIGAGAVSSFYPDFFCADLVEKGYFIIRYDQRDYGSSTHFPAVDSHLFKDLSKLKGALPYTINDLVEDAVAVLDFYNVKKAIVAGHSMGGTIAQLLSVIHPDRVTKLISMSVGPASANAKIEPIPEQTIHVLFANQPQGDIVQEKKGWMDSFCLLNGNMPFDEELAWNYLKDIYARDPKPAVAWNHIAVQNFLPNFDKEFNHSSIPTLILHGEEDPIQPVSYVKAVQHLIPHAQAFIFSQFGHMFFNRDCWEAIGEVFALFLIGNGLPG